MAVCSKEHAKNLCQPVDDRAAWEKVTKGRPGITLDNVVEKILEGCRGEPRRGGVRREVWEVQGRGRTRDRKKRKASAKKQGGIGKTLEDTRGIERRNRIRVKTYLHGPMDFARTLKLRFRVGDLDLPERRKR